MEYDPDTLHGLSDHTMVMTSVHTAYFHRQWEKQATGEPVVRYKWVEGSGISNYAHSAHSWLEFTQKPDFVNGLSAIVIDTNKNNDERAAAVEKYILERALEAGVVQEIKITQPRNPNKWGKTLAPWYNDDCRQAKKALADAKRQYGKGDKQIVDAIREFH